MPFTVDDADKHIKNLTPEKKKIWANVANSVLSQCIKNGGTDKTCAPKAIIQANGVIKRNEKDKRGKNMANLGDILFGNKPTVTFNLEGVEIFAVGTWNGDEYSLKDLEDMVASFDKVGFIPTLGIEHNEKLTEQTSRQIYNPILGRITDLRISGDKLVADFVKVPRKIYELITRGNYTRLSAEIFWNYKVSSGIIFRRVLKGVTLLGRDLPAVSSIQELENLYKEIEEGCVVYSEEFEDIKKHDLENLEIEKSDEETEKDSNSEDALDSEIVEDLNTSENELEKNEGNSEETKEIEENKMSDLENKETKENKEEETMTTEYSEKIKEMESKLAKFQEEKQKLESDKEKLEKEFKDKLKAKETEVVTLSARVEKTEQRLAENDAKLRSTEIKSFTDKLIKEGKLTPAILSGAIEVLEGASDSVTVEYKVKEDSETEKISQRERIQKFMESLPKYVEFVEVADDADGIVEGDFEDPADQLHSMTVQYMEKNGIEMNNENYIKAMDVVLEKNVELNKEFYAKRK